MKIRLTRILFLLLGIGYSYLAFGQDPSFSQYYANRIYLNPGMTGMEKGVRLMGAYRAQWYAVDKGFQTKSISVELREPALKSGFGLHLSADVEGVAALSTYQIGISYAYTIPLEKGQINAGFLISSNQRRLDWNALIFSDQLDPVFGNVNATEANMGLSKTNYWDFNAGLVWRSDSKLVIGGFERKLRSNIGIAIAHLPSLFGERGGNLSLLYQEVYLPARLTLHAGTRIPITKYHAGTKKKFVFIPNIKIDIQGANLNLNTSLRSFTYGALFVKNSFFWGAAFQNRSGVIEAYNTNTWVFNAGVFLSSSRLTSNQSPNSYIGFSYDLNTNGVGYNAGSVYELVFYHRFHDASTFFKKRAGKSNKREMDCYDFL